MRELLPLLPDVERIIDGTPEWLDLRPHLKVPDDVRQQTWDLAADTAPADVHGPGTVVLGAVGPDEGTWNRPDVLGAALRSMPVGTRVLLLCAWEPARLPYHRLLGPLGDASFQISDTVPLDASTRHSLRVALLASRVDALAPPRPYLMGLNRAAERAGDHPAGEPTTLGTLVRMANEHVLGEFVGRATHQRLRVLEHRVAELDAAAAQHEADRIAAEQHLRDRERQLAQATRELARARRRVATLESSARYRLGDTLVSGARHPGRAVVTVPKDLAVIWRNYRAKRTARAQEQAVQKPASPPRPTVRTVEIGVPHLRDAPDAPAHRTLSMTAPAAYLVPRKLDQHGLAGYETSAVSCFLATLQAAGPGAVLDIGANVGLYAGLASALTNRTVVAFEPSPSLVEVARRFCDDNNLGFRIEDFAVGREAGSATLYLSDSSDSSNSLAAGFRASTRQIEVPVETVDGYLARTGLTAAVIKIDTETTEPDVLFGAAETMRVHRPWILCEVLAGRVEERLTEALAPHGYHWYHITDQVPYTATTTIQGDTTYEHLMWLFAPQPPDEGFWASVRAWRETVAEQTPASTGQTALLTAGAAPS